MNKRVIALAAGAMLSATMLGACTKPHQGGTPPFTGKDCGTIDAKHASGGDAAKIDGCFYQYHLPPFPSRRLTIVDGDTTVVYQTPGGVHRVIITTTGPNGTKVEDCGSGPGFPFTGQVFLDGKGHPINEAC